MQSAAGAVLLDATVSEDEEQWEAWQARTEQFMLYSYKIKLCNRSFEHSWQECPFAHVGEKACRRDPQVFRYVGTMCRRMRRIGSCPLGDACPLAHNVFEYWLHPIRFRSQICDQGAECNRFVCFFAHSSVQLRQLPTPSLTHEAAGQAESELVDALTLLLGQAKGELASHVVGEASAVGSAQPPRLPALGDGISSNLRPQLSQQLPHASRRRSSFSGRASSSSRASSGVLSTWPLYHPPTALSAHQSGSWQDRLDPFPDPLMESRSRSTGADTLLQVPLADSSLMRFAPLSHSNLQAFNALNPSQTNSRTHPQARQRRAEPGSMRRQQSAQAALQQLRASSPDRQLHPLFQRQGVTGGQAIRPGVARLPQLQEAGRDDMPWPLASLAPDSPSAQPWHSHLQAPPLRSGASAAVRPFVTSPWQSVIEDSSQLPQLVRPAGMGSFHPPAGGSFQPAATGGSQGEGAAGMRYQGLISTPPTASAGWALPSGLPTSQPS